jgi:hypothetical protein
MLCSCTSSVPKAFVNGIAKIEWIGGGAVRFSFYERQCDGTVTLKKPAAELVTTLADLPYMILQATACVQQAPSISGIVEPAYALH